MRLNNNSSFISKSLIAGMSLLITSMMAMSEEGNIFAMKTYLARLDSNGTLIIDSNGYKCLEVPLVTFQERKNDGAGTWHPPLKFAPDIKINRAGEDIIVSLNYNKPGEIKNFTEKITLKPDTVSIDADAVAGKRFYSCSSDLPLSPDVFNGAEYHAISDDKSVAGKMPEDLPDKTAFILNGLNKVSAITFSETKVGTVSFNFTKQSPRLLSDLRAAPWSKKYNLTYYKTNLPPDEVFQYSVSIKISGDAKAAEKIPENTMESSAKILFELDFDNGFTANASGNGKNQNTNTPELVDGIKGKAAQFSKGKVLEYLEDGNLDKAKGTLVFWGKGNISDPYYDMNPSRTIFEENGKGKPGSNIMKLWKSTWGGLRLDIRNKENDCWGVYDIYNWTNNDWHHVAVTWNNKKGIAIYLDGRLAQTARMEDWQRGLKPAEWMPVPAKTFFIGASDKAGNYSWLGALDEIRIFDRDLSLPEVQKEYVRSLPGKLVISTNDQYLSSGKSQNCRLDLYNSSDKAVTITPECTVITKAGEIVFSKKFPGKTIQSYSREYLDLPLNLPVSGDYKLRVNYCKNFQDIALKVLPLRENENPPESLKLKLVKTIDAVNPPADDMVTQGDNAVVNSSIGEYRETGSKIHDRFALGFELEETDVPYMAVVTWPDNTRRSMDILFLGESSKEAYQATGGIFAGDAFFPSGKMKEYKIIFWPRTKKSAFVFMCLENGYPAAVKDIKIYRIESGLPKLPVCRFEGSVPARHIGIFYEDPVIPVCFGAGHLFPYFETSVDRMLDYMQWFGQDILTYPLAWVDGPLYGSAVEPIVANRSIRLHPDNYPAYLLKRLEARGMKFNGTLQALHLTSLDHMAIIDERKVFAGEETIINMQADNHLRLTTPWNSKEPRYNILDPKVQGTVKALIKEILARYGDSPAFSGITFWPTCYAFFTIGSLESGYNDINLTRFQQDTGIKISCYNPKDTYRFAKSYQWLMDNAKESWIEWRCKMLHQFYKELADMLTARRNDLRLSILFEPMEIPSICSEYRQAEFSQNDRFKSRGIDLSLFQNDKNIEICTYSRHCQMQYERAMTGAKMGIESLRAYGLIPELAKAYEDLPQTSSILFDAYWEDRVGRTNPLEDLKKILPNTTERGLRCGAINANTFYELESYVAALNNFDSLSITKGGFAIGTLGIEDWVGNFSRAYRTLPAVKFDNIEGLADPVRVRQKVVDAQNYVYVLNRLPVEVKFTLTLSQDAEMKDLISGQSVPSTAEMTLAPYDLRTFSVADSIKVVGGQSVTPESFVSVLDSLLKEAEKNFSALEKTGVQMDNYRIFLDAARDCAAKKQYARLYILLYESWSNDMKRLLENKTLQSFLKAEANYLEKQNKKRHVSVPEAKEKLKIDGILDEAAWKNAAVINDFADFMGYNGKLLAKPADPATEVRLLYDDTNIYLGITCEEPETNRIIVNKCLRDGRLWEGDDSVEFFFKNLEHREGQFAQFLVNAASSQTDLFASNLSWNIDWQVQSRIIPGKGWICEIAIPLKEIGKISDGKLLFNIGRYRGSNPVSGLSMVYGRGGWFCEQYWTELTLDKT